jgi:hypothetical protein
MVCPELWARMVSTDETRLNTIKGIFSANAARNVFTDRILPKGYQSRINNTTGRLTAMGLLIRARIKKHRAKK